MFFLAKYSDMGFCSPLRICKARQVPGNKLLIIPKRMKKCTANLQSYARNLSKYLLQKKSRFLRYLHFYKSYDHNLFTDVFSGVRRMFLIPVIYSYDDFLHLYSNLKCKSSQKQLKIAYFGTWSHLIRCFLKSALQTNLAS